MTTKPARGAPRGVLEAVYVMVTPRGVVHYVGRSANPKQRSRSHKATIDGRRIDSLTRRNVPKSCRMEVVAYAHPDYAADLERSLAQFYGV